MNIFSRTLLLAIIFCTTFLNSRGSNNEALERYGSLLDQRTKSHSVTTNKPKLILSLDSQFSNGIYGGKNKKIILEIKIPEIASTPNSSMSVTLHVTGNQTSCAYQPQITPLMIPKGARSLRIEIPIGECTQDQVLSFSASAEEFDTSDELQIAIRSLSETNVTINVSDDYLRGVYGSRAGIGIPAKVKIPESRINMHGTTLVKVKTIYFNGEQNQETAFSVWLEKGKSEANFSISIPAPTKSSSTLNAFASLENEIDLTRDHKLSIPIRASGTDALILDIDPKYHGLYGGRNVKVPIVVRIPQGKENIAEETLIELFGRVGAQTQTLSITLKIPPGKNEVAFEIPFMEAPTDQSISFWAHGTHFLNTPKKTIYVFAPGQLKIAVDEKFNRIYGNGQKVNIPVTIKLPAGRPNKINSTPISLCYKLPGSIRPLIIVGVIPAGDQEITLFLNAGIKSYSNNSIDLWAESPNFRPSSHIDIDIQGNGKSLALEVANGNESIYGGDEKKLPIVIKIPEALQCLAQSTTVSLSIRGEGVSHLALDKGPFIIPAGESQLEIEIPVSTVTEFDKGITIIAVSDNFTEPVTEIVTLLNSQPPIEIEVDDKYDRIYGPQTIPVKITIPHGHAYQKGETTLSLTVSGTAAPFVTLPNTPVILEANSNEVIVNIEVAKLTGKNDQEFILKASCPSDREFSDSGDLKIELLSSQKSTFQLSSDTKIYGGSSLPIKVQIPKGRENNVSSVPVTIIHDLNGKIEELTQSIAAGLCQTIFDIPITEVNGVDQIRSIRVRPSDNFLADKALSVTIRASDSESLQLSTDNNKKFAGVPFLVRVKAPKACPKELPITLTVDGGKSLFDIFQLLDEDVIIPQNQDEVVFELIAKKTFQIEKTVRLEASAPSLHDAETVEIIINKSSENTLIQEEETTNNILQTYGGGGNFPAVTVPIQVKSGDCTDGKLGTINLDYKGDLSIANDKPLSVKTKNGQGEFSLKIGENKSEKTQLITVTASNEHLSGYAIDTFGVRVLKKGSKKISLSANNSDKPTIYSDQGSISLVITVPKEAVDELNSNTIQLRYQGNDNHLIREVLKVTLEKGKVEIPVNLPILKFENTPQIITITASDSRQNFISSEPLEIKLTKGDPIELSTILALGTERPSFKKGDNSASLVIDGGQDIKIKVKIPKRHDVPRTSTVAVTITYNGDGKDFLSDQIETIQLDPNNDEVEFWVKIKNLIDANNKTLEIRAISDYYVTSLPLRFELRKNVELFSNSDANSLEQITLPHRPRLYLNENHEWKAHVYKRVMRSAKPIDGFWVSCRLTAKADKKDVTLAYSGVKKGFELPNDDAADDDNFCIWVPLKNNPQTFNKNYYWATSSYNVGNAVAHAAGKSMQVSHSTSTNSTANVAYVNEKGEVERKSQQDTNGKSIGGSVEGTFKHNHGVGIPGTMSVKNEFSVGIRVHGDMNWSNVTGLNKDHSVQNTFRDEIGVNKMTGITFNETREGPRQGFLRMHVPFYPILEYTFGDPRDNSPINIADCINYGSVGRSMASVNKPGIVDFIRQVFSTNENGKLINLPKYLSDNTNKLPEKLREKLNRAADLINAHKNSVTDIDVERYAVSIFNGKIEGISAKLDEDHIDVPTACNLSSKVRISQFFKKIDGAIKSCFVFNNLPYSATETQVEIRNSVGRIVHAHSEQRDVDAKTFEPLTEQSIIPFEEHSGKYTVSLKYRCGRSNWSDEYKQEFELDRGQQCSLDLSKVKTTVNQNEKTITVAWEAPSEGATAYTVEYATDKYDFSFETEKKESSVFGGNHRFDVPFPDTKYIHPLDGSKKILYRITPMCRLGPGVPLVFLYDSEKSTLKEQEVCDIPEIISIKQARSGSFNITVKRKSNYYREGLLSDNGSFDIQIKKRDAEWPTAASTLASGENLFEAEPIVDPLNKDQLILVHALTSASTDPKSEYVARVRAFCHNSNTKAGISTMYLRTISGWSDASKPFLINNTGASIQAEGQTTLSSGYRYASLERNSKTSISLDITPNCIDDRLIFSVLNLDQELINANLNIYSSNRGKLIYTQAVSSIIPGQQLVVYRNLEAGVYILELALPNGQAPITKNFCRLKP